MDRFYKMMKRDNKGFTLVELMVVLLILGILVAIAIPIYNNVTGKANLNAIAANLKRKIPRKKIHVLQIRELLKALLHSLELNHRLVNGQKQYLVLKGRICGIIYRIQKL